MGVEIGRLKAKLALSTYIIPLAPPIPAFSSNSSIIRSFELCPLILASTANSGILL